MSDRATSENSDTVGLFPFLAVLLCTMGALLVILVVLVQRAAERAAMDAIAQADVVESPESLASATASSTEDAELAATLKQELDEVHQHQQRLKTLRTKAEARLRDEQAKLSHLEEHTRRLEHELARLSIAAQQLEATEKNQAVDQEQAESELTHLKSLITENEERLDELREQSDGSRSYSIVPYQGPNGTTRKPIYLECNKEGVIIQPEGLLLTENDFAAPSWPGNPLAAALRASREYLNAKAKKAGEPEPPDPYPLLLIRPDGIGAYRAARVAITSWDSDYGYEFIAGDWKLDFPELADPVLAQVQQHAVLNARDNMALLARAAPSRFGGMSVGGSGAHASGGASSSHGYGPGGKQDSSNGYDAISNSTDGDASHGNGLAAGEAEAAYALGDAQSGQQQTEGQYGTMPGGHPGDEASGDQTASNGDGGSEAGSFADTAGKDQNARGANSGQGSTQNTQAASGSLAQSGSSGQSSGASSSGSSGGTASNGSRASGGGAQASSASMALAKRASSIAESQGRNWAIDRGSRGAVPISRPIEVVVRKNQLAILPSRHSSRGIGATGTIVSLNQPTAQISKEFVEALRARVKEWGLAGNGLYWHPVLELNVGPDAHQTAHQITRLLENSGVEILYPKMAQAGQGESTRAPK